MPRDDWNHACAECGKEYVLTADELEYFTRKEDTSSPKLCWSCRELRKIERGSPQHRQKHWRKNETELR